MFPKCTQPEFVVENIQKVFDTNGDGFISIREILIAFSMAMTGSPREKLHWAFRLYDADQRFGNSYYTKKMCTKYPTFFNSFLCVTLQGGL